MHDGPKSIFDENLAIRDKLDALVKANPWLTYNRLSGLLRSIGNENSSGRAKRSKFIQIAKEMDGAIAPFTPCRHGCGHCCNGHTLVFKHEAELLARVSGRSMAYVPPPTQKDLERQREFRYTPCPFLVDNACSVYEHRPLACRLTHSLNENADACVAVADGHRARVNTFEVGPLMQAYDELADRIDYTDIPARILDFFPAK